MEKLNFKSRIQAYLLRGLGPRQIALTISLAFVLGIFPLYGITTLLMLFTASRLKLNSALMISTGYLFTPLLFVFWIPFIQFGQWILQLPTLELTQAQLSQTMEKGWFEMIQQFSITVLKGILGWLVVSPIILWISYLIFKFIALRIQAPLENLIKEKKTESFNSKENGSTSKSLFF